MKKAVILGNIKLGYSWFVLTTSQGLQLNGYKVHGIDYKSTPLNIIKQKILDIKPSIIYTHLSFHQHINPTSKILQLYRDIKNKIDVKVVHTCQDCRTHDRYMGDLRGSIDYAFVGTESMLKNCQRAFKIPVFYTLYSSLCYDEIAEYDPSLAFKELVFTGSRNAHQQGFDVNRADFLNRLSKKVPMKFFQTQSGNDLRHKTPELSRSAKCILGACVGYSNKYYAYKDVRYFQYMGTGSTFIARPFTTTRKIIPDDLYFSFDNYNNDGIEQIKEHYQRCLKEDTMPMKIKAFEFMQKYHSCKSRIKDQLDCTEGKKEIGIDYYNYEKGGF